MYLVKKAMNIHLDFILWCLALYENLSVSVVINKYSSEKIFVKRDFLEGHSYRCWSRIEKSLWIKKWKCVSGTERHRDPSTEKCQALDFGTHKQYIGWPSWVTDKNEIITVIINRQNYFWKC